MQYTENKVSLYILAGVATSLNFMDDFKHELIERYEHAPRPGQLARAARSGNPITLVTLDLDNFEELNDELGHEQGDRALRDTAERVARRSAPATWSRGSAATSSSRCSTNSP